MITFVRRVFLAIAVCTLLGGVWLAAGGPIGLDRWLDVTEPPVQADAIVVLGGGTDGRNLPLSQGWARLQTAAELFADRFAPVVILSGGGGGAVSEAEVYANAAAWLGIPRDAMHLETTAQATIDHGRALLGFVLPGGRSITSATPLLVVTSALHSRRALRSFHRAGFTRVRTVASYTAVRGPGSLAPVAGSPAALRSTVAEHHPSGKHYDDVLFRLAYRSFDMFIGLRETAAIVAGR